MSDHDRGAYAPPTDAPLTFDARQPVRGTRPLPTTLIISMLVLAGLATAIFLFYRQGVRQAGQPPQAVGTPVAGMKAAPPAEAQPADPAAGLSIYKSEGAQASSPAQPPQPTFTPAPEQPIRRAETPPAAPVVVAPPAAQPAAQPAHEAAVALRPALPAQPPAAKLAQAAPAPKPAVAPPAPKTAAAPPAPKTEVTPPKAVAAAPAAPKPAPPPAKTAAAAPAPAAGAAAGGSFVQIGAVSSQALADKAWTDAAALVPGQAAGKGKNVEKVDRDGKTLYRVQITGFASKADATAFCGKLKAAGKDCFAR
jgi:hypothetical protein